MQVHCDEGIANHIGPEPCAGIREDVGEASRRRMHQSIPEQGRWLKQVVTGYFNYHAVPTNGPTLTAFRFHVTNLWRRTLRRRSQKDWTTKRNGPRGWPTIGSQNRESFTPGRMRALQSDKHAMGYRRIYYLPEFARAGGLMGIR